MSGESGRTLVTGGAGFIGSHLVDRLVAEGWAVLVVDDLSTGRNDWLSPEARLEVADVTVADLESLVRTWRPDVVYHLAAQASVPRSMADPLADLATNVVGTHRTASAARSAGVRRLVFTSSGGAIYGETRIPAREDAIPAPRSFYGIHKLAAEGHVALSGLEYAIARPSNVYGPRQVPGLEGAVIPAFLEQARRTGRLNIDGDGQQTRDFVHVTDVVEALLRLGRLGEASGTWNVAAGASTSVLELAALVEAAIGRTLPRRHAPSRPGDVRHSTMDSGRLRALGWSPIVRLADGIASLARGSARSDSV